MGKLSDRINTEVTAWKPGDGGPAVIEGVVVDVDIRHMQGGPGYTDRDVRYLEVADEDGRTVWGVLALHQVLDNELEKRRPSPGDGIAIAYEGQKDGKSYHSYRVVTERHATPQAVADAWGGPTPTAAAAAPAAPDYTHEPF